MGDVIIGTNDRGKADLLRVGAERNTLYMAHKERDGTIIMRPMEVPREAVGG